LNTAVFKKVAEILTGKVENTYINTNMERGNELEMTARNAYELETGNIVKTVGYWELDEFVEVVLME